MLKRRKTVKRKPRLQSKLNLKSVLLLHANEQQSVPSIEVRNFARIPLISSTRLMKDCSSVLIRSKRPLRMQTSTVTLLARRKSARPTMSGLKTVHGGFTAARDALTYGETMLSSVAT